MEETLEEAAERVAKLKYGPTIYGIERVNAFKDGAKWQQENYGLMEIELRHTKTLLASCEKALEERDKQQERSYSEEDLHKAYCAGSDFDMSCLKGEQYYMFNNWFEYFKKK